jgi:hypothetical protein
MTDIPMTDDLNFDLDLDLDDWNAELEDEVEAKGIESLVVYSRDWTVETILSQIEKDNIDLNPDFQRRNAWNMASAVNS